MRQESDGLRRYCHVGTGNYNPKTARLYTDLGLLTCDPEVGQDLTRLFNQLSRLRPEVRGSTGCWSRRARCAPAWSSASTARRTAASAGPPAWVKIKVNSVVDEATIDALYRASQVGRPGRPRGPRHLRGPARACPG